MTTQNGGLHESFETVTSYLEEFIKIVEAKDGQLMATDLWTVDDVLRHVTFWHRNYAANYRALAQKKRPPLLVGPGYKLNVDSVSTLKKYSRSELIKLLRSAHKSLHTNILVNKVPQMTYKEGGNTYTSLRFLEVVEAHLRGHIKQIKRAKS
jgi:hypothetical protein